MRRNMDLVRQLLLTVEAQESGSATTTLQIDGYSQEEVSYHAYLILQAGLASGTELTTRGSSSPTARLRSLTWEGHEFLDAAREPGRWQQAKAVIEQVAAAPFDVWKAVLIDLVKQSSGL
jgi:hypothetical protein